MNWRPLVSRLTIFITMGRLSVGQTQHSVRLLEERRHFKTPEGKRDPTVLGAERGVVWRGMAWY